MSQMTVANDSYGTNAVLSTPCPRVWTTDSTRLDLPQRQRHRRRRRRWGYWILAPSIWTRNSAECARTVEKQRQNLKKVKKKLRITNLVLCPKASTLCFPHFDKQRRQRNHFREWRKNSTIHQWHSRIRITNATFQIWFWSAQKIGIGNGISL